MKKTTNEFYCSIAFHPGETLSEKLSELNLSAEEFALQSNISVDLIKKIISGDQSVTLEIAKLLELLLKIPYKFWIKKQLMFDNQKSI